MSLTLAGDDEPALERLRALYADLPQADGTVRPESGVLGHLEADAASRSGADGAVRHIADRSGRPGSDVTARLTLSTASTVESVPLPGGVGRRALAAHRAVAQACAALAAGHVFHGAVLRRGADHVLLLGPASAGKTTLALALAARGWTLLADDFAWLDPGGRWCATPIPPLLTRSSASLLGLDLDTRGPVLEAGDGRVFHLVRDGADDPTMDDDETDRLEIDDVATDLPETVAPARLRPPARPGAWSHPAVASALGGRGWLGIALLRPEPAGRVTPRALETALVDIAASDAGLAGRRFLFGATGADALASVARMHAALAALGAHVFELGRAEPATMAARIEAVADATASPPIASAPSAPPAPSTPRIIRIPIRGGSMRPLLRDGDVVRVDTTPGAAAVGDVVVVRGAEGLVAHRLIEIRERSFVTRGDDTPFADPPHSADSRLAAGALIGRVVAVEGIDGRRLDGLGARRLGKAVAWLGRHRSGRGRGRRPALLVRAALAAAVWRRTPSPEERFVMLAARMAHSERDLAAARELLAHELEGAEIEAIARRAQLGPLVYRGARIIAAADSGSGLEAAPDPAPDPIDPAVTERLRRLYAIGWERSRRVADERDGILEALAEIDVPVMGHKGVVLAEVVYRDPALRLCGDIDLSVLDADRPRAEAAVADRLAVLRARHPDARDPDGLRVELDGTVHHDVDPTAHGRGRWACTALDWAAVWRRARRIEIGRQRMPLLVPEATDLFVMLVANGLRRGGYPARLLADIAATSHVLRDDIDWTRLETTLARTRLCRRSWWLLGLAVDLFGASVPAHLCEPPPDVRLAPWERAILAWRRRYPLSRIPSRILWAGSGRAAMVAGLRMARGRG